MFLDRTVLPQTGTYTVVLDPTGAAVGVATATLFDVPPDVTATITAGGPAVSVTTSVPGQNARVTFTGGAGEVLSLNVSAVTILSGTVSILRPDGTQLTSKTFTSSGVFVDVPALPVAGTYTIVFDPASTLVGGATLKLVDVPTDIVGAITQNGASVPLTISTPGQNARLMFSGTAGESVSVLVSGLTITSGFVSILRPDGTTLAIKPFNAPTSAFVDRAQLPSTGTYTVFVDPSGASVGAATVSLYDVPPDLTGTITVGGAPVRVATAAPGQNATLAFAGSAGQSLTVSVTAVTYPSLVVSVLRPGGIVIATRFLFSSGGTITVTLPVAGTYTLLVDPVDAATGAATVALT
jgi:hypothetical protein